MQCIFVTLRIERKHYNSKFLTVIWYEYTNQIKKLKEYYKLNED